MHVGRSQAWFWLAGLFESGLLALAAVLAPALDTPFFPGSRPTLNGLVLGALGMVPPFLLFLALLQSRRGPWVEIRRFLEGHLRPIFGSWSWYQLAFVSILAGVSEEILFRGVLQGGLSAKLGPVLGVSGASLVFGLCHFVSRAYAAVVFAMGVYLGLLWMWTGDLWTPILTHALYDFVALVYFLKIRAPESNEHATGTVQTL